MAKKSKRNRSAALYARVASLHPADKEKTLDKQIEHIKNYCSANGLTVLTDYQDAGFSGSNLDRPGFQRMMADISDGKINMVIVKDYSRLSRSAEDLMNICSILREKNIELLSITQI